MQWKMLITITLKCFPKISVFMLTINVIDLLLVPLGSARSQLCERGKKLDIGTNYCWQREVLFYFFQVMRAGTEDTREKQLSCHSFSLPVSLPALYWQTLIGSPLTRNVICSLQCQHDKAEQGKIYLELGNHGLITNIKCLIVQ